MRTDRLVGGFIALSAIASMVMTPVLLVSAFFMSQRIEEARWESVGFWFFTGILGVVGALMCANRVLDYMNKK